MFSFFLTNVLEDFFFQKKNAHVLSIFFLKKKIMREFNNPDAYQQEETKKEKKNFVLLKKNQTKKNNYFGAKKNNYIMSNDHKLALTTVTYNDRKSLLKVFRRFLSYTDTTLLPFTWYVALQNCSDEFVQQVIDIFKEYASLSTSGQLSITLVLCRFKQNIGLSKAMSYLIEKTKRFELTLNIEDDWILLDTHVPSSRWLDASVKFLDTHADASAVFLRAYAGSSDKHQYGWTRTIPYKCHEFKDNFNYEQKMKDHVEIVTQTLPDDVENKFQLIPDFLFTFNPVVTRNSDYHKYVYPLPKFANDQKDPQYQANWGCCEAVVMERTRKAGLRTFWLNQGIFGHNEDFFPDE